MSARRRHVYRWWDGDVYRQESFPTKAEKQEFMAEIARRRRLGLALCFEPVEPDPRLDAFIEDYWRLHAIPNLDHATRRTYLQQWDRWIRPQLGGYRLAQITAKVINRQLLGPMRKADAGDATVRSVLAVLQSILALAVAEERIAANPVAKVSKPPASVERDVPPVAPAVVERMRARLGVRDATIISLLAYEGLRPEEVLALHVEDLGDGGIRVRRKVVTVEDPARPLGRGRHRGQVVNYTKTRRKRTVPWTSPDVQRDLVAYQLATGIRRGLLFPTPRGEPWAKHDYNNWRKRVYQPLAHAVGLPDPRPYDLRGSFVSLLAWEGYTMLEVARRAGHSVQTCERYYAKIFEDADPATRVTAAAAIAQARQPGVAGVERLFDLGAGT